MSAFSLAGVSKKNALGRPHGFQCETQGTLFFEIERILEAKQPRAFLLENVKNLQSHDGGRTFGVIKRTLERLKYTVYTNVLDARCFVPQHRERVYLVGFREDVDFSWEDVGLPPPSGWPVLRSVLHPEDGTEVPEPPFTDEAGKVSPRYILTPGLWTYLRQYEARHRASGHGFGFGLVGPNDVARTLSARYYKDGSEILLARDGGPPRRLTPRECARLMGFDRDERIFGIPVSDTQAYRQFGNSVVVPMIQAIASAMRPYILGESVPALSCVWASHSRDDVVDIVDKAARSRMMGGIRGKHTKPEILVRSFLHRSGLRFRLHGKRLPGRPDIVLPKYRMVIFVHGCFWHRHRGCRFAYSPQSNVDFWKAKLDGNAERDRRQQQQLRRAGWKVRTVWECQTTRRTSSGLLKAFGGACPGRRSCF